MSENQTSGGLSASFMKDAIVVLSFLAGIAGVYVKITEQVVRLEQKVTSLEEKTKELKESNNELQKVILGFRGQVLENSERFRNVGK